MINEKHRSETLDRMIGQNVEVIFRDGKTESGILFYPEYQCPYGIHAERHDVVFYKSFVKAVRKGGSNETVRV